MKKRILDELSDLLFFESCFMADEWTYIRVIGTDAEVFLQGQVTQDLNKIAQGKALWSTRLNRQGRIQNFFILAKAVFGEWAICIEHAMADLLLQDLEKFIISQDVSFEKRSGSYFFHINYFISQSADNFKKPLFEVNLFGVTAGFCDYVPEEVKETPKQKLNLLRWLNGFPSWCQEVSSETLINESCLNEIAISYSKGCFLGQETAGKLQSHRGGAYYPVFLEFESANLQSTEEDFRENEIFYENKKIGKVLNNYQGLFQVALLREYRVEGMKLCVSLKGKELEWQNEATKVQYLPFVKNQTRESVADEIYHQGVTKFQNGADRESLTMMELSLKFYPKLFAAYESIGVILGRLGKYDEAINWMDKLLAAEPNSVLAHTNKSLFLMKQGKIAEAEEEKAKATLSSFAFFGDEAKLKAEKESLKKKKEFEMKRKKEMFEQVLAIDENDLLALLGLAEAGVYLDNCEEAYRYIKKAIGLNPENAKAFKLLGEVKEKQNAYSEAIDAYENGVLLASKKGELKLASEMQSKINLIEASVNQKSL